MIVTIVESVFTSLTDPLSLLAVLAMGEEGRHLIQTDPVFDPDGESGINNWLATLSGVIAERVTFALEEGIRADSGTGHDIHIRIEPVAAPMFEHTIPRLPLKDALSLMQRPLALLVENRRNDGAFLRRVATGRWRREVEHVLHNEWATFEHGGGLENMKRRVDGTANEPRDRLRLWVLFDSDAREPETPSTPSEALRARCIERDVEHHQLARRAMENYLPVPVLIRSADSLRGPLKTRRRKVAQALQRMPGAQRHCYNMKGGFSGDRGKDGKTPVPAHFAEFAQHPDLQDGFGRNIGELFGNTDMLFEERWFVSDGQTDETDRVVQALLRRL